MEIAYIKVTFDGLYSWGNGWENGSSEHLWDEFWKNRNDIFWHFFEKSEGFGTAQYLVGTSGSAYLHPMDFEVVERIHGKSYRNINGTQVRIFPEFEELKEICKECAEYCGCGVWFSEVKVREVDF